MNDSKTPELIFMYGYPASGKTTFAKEYVNKHPDFNLISADSIRQELYGSQDTYGEPYVIYTKILYKMRKLLKEEKNVIYDATNLWRQYRLDYLLNLQGIECYKTIIQLDAEKEVCIARHLNRGRNIPVEKLLPYFDINERPTFKEGWDEIKTYCINNYVITSNKDNINEHYNIIHIGKEER